MVQQKWLKQLVFFFLAFLLFTLSGCAAAPAAMSPSQSSERAAPAGAAAPAPANDTTMAGQPTGAGFQRQIVAKASISLVVQDTQKAVDGITVLMAQVKGYVANANLYKSDHDGASILQGTLTLRVPANQTDQAIKQLEALAIDVGSKNLSREDVTDQYADVDAQLRNLTAAETELRALLAEVRAKPNAKSDDVLTVYQHITEIRGQIDQLQGHKNVLDNLISLATIEVTLTPDALTQPVVEAGWRPVAAMHSALRSLVSTLQVVGTAAIWVVIYLLPILLIVLGIFGAIFWSIRFLLRRLSRKSKLATA